MADASQQVKEWGRYAAPPGRDVGAALAALSEEDLLRLRAIARLRARSLPDGMSWSDLLHEAVLRALTGARPWPPGVPLLAFLAGVMRSLCDEQWRRHRRQDHLPACTIVAGLMTRSGPVRQRRRSPPFNGCSRPTRQH
jgi:DNA-directed RNA polymerase specialized sigma24 family protein